ncbi:MAG: NADH-quinone oxidoreductase subunit J [Isosphaeraceae bacterium]
MPTSQMILITLIVLTGAGGTYLLLPHRFGQVRKRTAHLAGAGLAGLALVGFLGLLSPAGPFLAGLFFYLFSIGAVVGALLTVTSRNPIYSALWFASVVLCTAGLFLLAGAQFLAAGTIIVYAGAIIVTFLFVIMLAQMEGKAEYDRAARAPGTSTITCFLLLWSLMYLLGSLVPPDTASARLNNSQASAERVLVRSRFMAGFYNLHERHPANRILGRVTRPTSAMLDASGAAKPNVAGLGEALYADHLVTVELAGALLFVALVAAVVITSPRRPVRPGEAVPAPPQESRPL